MKLYISKFLEEKKLDLKQSNYEIIIDIPKTEFISNIKYLFLNLLYPLYYNKKKIFINNIFDSNKEINIDTKYIHENKDVLDIYLYLDSWNKLIMINHEKHEYKMIYKLDKLNVCQQRAVDTLDGPFRLLAPAGSGKTKTLINRILNLLNNGIKSENILVLAFNKKAEIELSNRIFQYSINNIEIKTFHSFCNQILKKYSDLEDACDDYEFINNTIISDLLHDNNISLKFSNDYSNLFSLYKNTLTDKDDMVYMGKNIYLLYLKYIERILDEKLYGFDDMIYFSIRLLLNNGKLRSQFQNKYKYILVDEVQDLNDSQILLIKILSLPTNNLFIVGDDDQMIYSFRGSNINGILNFENNYSCCISETLKINYRSKANIVNKCKRFIDNNEHRVFKEIIPFSNSNGNLELFIAKNILEECEKVINWINYQKKMGIYDIAILYRYNELGNIINTYLNLNRIITNSSEDFEKVLNIITPFFNYFFSVPTFEDYKSIIRSQGYNIKDSKSKVINNNKKFLKYLKECGLSNFAFKLELLRKILKKKDLKFKYFTYFLRLNKVDGYNDIFKIINKFGTIKEVYNKINSKSNTSYENNVVLSTIHKVKGNEFESVCYFHITTPDDDIENERRISYVAFTRAKSNLLVTTIKNDELKFVKEFFYEKKDS